MKFYLLIFGFCLFAPTNDQGQSILPKDPKVTMEKVTSTNKNTDQEKDAVKIIYNMHRNYFISFGGIVSLNDFYFFACANTLLYSSEVISKNDTSFSWVRNLYFEGGIMWELIPFFGLSFSLVTKEFNHLGSQDYSFVNGGKMALFAHLSYLFIEGGLFIREGQKGFFSFKNFGVSFYISAKFKKDFFLVGGGLIL